MNATNICPQYKISNHGPDEWSMEDRLIQSIKETEKAEDKLNEYYKTKGE